MKKLLSLIVPAMILAGCSSLFHPKSPEEKAAQEWADSVQAVKVAQAIDSARFVLTADRLTTRRGHVIYVTRSTNFVRVNGDKGTVQVAFANAPGLGPNGLGGITLNGRVTNYQVKNPKPGLTSISFNVTGIGISSEVTLLVPEGGENSTVTINANTRPERITLSGDLLPLTPFAVYEGMSL